MEIGVGVSYVVCPWKFTMHVSILKAPIRHINYFKLLFIKYFYINILRNGAL